MGSTKESTVPGISNSNIALTDNDITFSEGSWWDKRTSLEKGLLVVSVLAACAAVAFIVAFAVVYASPGDKTCVTEDCVVAAARVRASMDPSVKPCDNFYQFACGGWMKINIIPEDRSSLDTFGVLRDEIDVTLKGLLETKSKPDEIAAIKKAKDLYVSCMNETRMEERGIQPGLNFLVSIGGWPVLDPAWDEKSFNLEDLMIKLRLHNNVPLLNMYVGTDLKNSTTRKIYIDQPDFGMPGRKYYLRGRDDVMVKAYEELIVKIATALGANKTTVKQDAKDIVDFEFIIANISVPAEERRDSEKLYNLFTVSDLAGNFSGFDWLKYMQTIMNATGVEISITEDEEIINRSPPYMEKFMNVLQSASKRLLANYLVWRITIHRVSSLTEQFRNFFTQYNKVLYGTISKRARFRTCSSYVTTHLGKAVGRLFVDATFDEEAKQIALEMITNLRTAFNELLDEIDWMDAETKTVAREKADAIVEKIGYPEGIKNDTELNIIYEKYEYDPRKYFENVVLNIKRSAVLNLKELRAPVIKNIWTTAPSTVNAYYSSLKNQIMFPAGILQPPFYHKTNPKSLNYGGIGVVIGHEITHGFDDRGRQYDKDGNLKQWWNNDVIQRFKAKADCIIKQYSNYVVPEAGMNVNGVNTQGENIADNGGLKQSYRAYREWVGKQGEEPPMPGLAYSHNQLFFINFAQVWCSSMRREDAINRILTGVHSPGRFRVIGALQNSKDFAQAFQCPKGSYMNPDHKCHLW